VTLSVIVPAFNEERLLPESLHSIRTALQACDEAGWQWELIVCDNNSTDRTAEIAAAAGATVVFEPINQIGRARNAGAARATGDWLLFVDADSFPTRELVADMIAVLSAGDCLAGGSRVRSDVQHRGLQIVLAWWNWMSRTFRWAAGSFVFCDAAVFRQIGGFSNALYAGEEVDLFRRLKRVARRTHRRIVILDDHPLLTSGRKAHLYSPREAAWFWAKTFFSAGLNFRSRKGASIWYDGRR
jgi:glycosyltransferase involved in cell wall biosynthesis